MKIYWPRRSPGLPPGQRLMDDMPRFGENPSPPPEPSPLRLEISVNRVPVAEVTETDLEALGLDDHCADFHCVTTWSVTDLTWTGVPLHRVIASVGLDERSAPYLVARAADHRRGHFIATDALADNVILATRLNGKSLGARHGGPLRLVAPQLYAYKSIKHLISIDFRNEPPNRLGLEHLRGRVAYEERHPTLPSWLVRTPYRILIPPTAHLAERSLRRSKPSIKDV
ncbi:MAG: molybdopterin-dependent oxidoreductase [bacterium]|nr:molybdopterin-dependent oxidoreductase [bacterium]